MNFASLLHEGDSKQDEQKVSENPDCNNHDAEEDKESLSGADQQKEEDKDDTALLVWCAPAAESPLLTIIEEMEEMFLWLT